VPFRDAQRFSHLLKSAEHITNPQPLNSSECVLAAWPLKCGTEIGASSVINKEQRKSRRYLIRLPVTVRWADESINGEAKTETRDVSSHGLRFDLPKDVKSGSALEILMTLPHQLTNAGPVRVHCAGYVLRTSFKDSDKVEVVAAIQRFQFTRDSENAV
jgi:hypothetical protein